MTLRPVAVGEIVTKYYIIGRLNFVEEFKLRDHSSTNKYKGLTYVSCTVVLVQPYNLVVVLMCHFIGKLIFTGQIYVKKSFFHKLHTKLM